MPTDECAYSSKNITLMQQFHTRVQAKIIERYTSSQTDTYTQSGTKQRKTPWGYDQREFFCRQVKRFLS